MNGGASVWAITPEERGKHDKQFDSLAPILGFVSGDQARKFFLQSGLPPSVLAEIWNLADMDSDGKMDRLEFSIAMKLIKLKLQGRNLPSSLPIIMKQTPVSNAGASIPSSARFGLSLSGFSSPMVFSPTDGLSKANSLLDLGSTSSNSSSTTSLASNSPKTGASDWAVPQASRLKYRQQFNTLDKLMSGYLSGPQVRNALMASNLTQTQLATIWTLADVDKDGQLRADEFILAMHLVDMAKTGRPLPLTLPQDLIPPSLRGGTKPIELVNGNGPYSTSSLLDIENEPVPKTKSSSVSYEDKLKENFARGSAELEKRRLALEEQQKKEKERREREEREAQERREREAREMENRRRLEEERRMERQREIERQREEERLRELERKEAAKQELERQRREEWERGRKEELSRRREGEQDEISQLKARKKSLELELEAVGNKHKQISDRLRDAQSKRRIQKAEVDLINQKRDARIAEINTLQIQFEEWQRKLSQLVPEQQRLTEKLRTISLNKVPEGALLSLTDTVTEKGVSCRRLKDQLNALERETTGKLEEMEQYKKELQELREKQVRQQAVLDDLYRVKEEKHRELQRRRDEERERRRREEEEAARLAKLEQERLEQERREQERREQERREQERLEQERRQKEEEEVDEQTVGEPGWLCGSYRGNRGWFPQSYAQKCGPHEASMDTGPSSPLRRPSCLPQPLNTGIPEIDIICDNTVPLQIDASQISFPLLARALSSWSPTSDLDLHFSGGDVITALLSFSQGDIISVLQQRDDWWLGQLNGTQGWFPKGYVTLEAAGGTDVDSLDSDSQLEEYVALYTYESPEVGDLTFVEGDVVMVTEREGEWWRGCIGDQTGVFPSNYVRPVEPETSKPGGPNKKPEIAQAVTASVSPMMHQLCLSPGQLIVVLAKNSTGWWLGELQARGKRRQRGWFHSSHVKLLGPSSSKSSPSPLPVCQVIAMYDYTAANPDELSFSKGQLISVMDKTNPDWWKGEASGVIGLLPTNYIKMTTESDPSQQ